MTQHGPLTIETFIEEMFQENGYLLWSDAQPEAWIIDPGFSPQPEEMAAAIRTHGLQPAAILVTHAHPDHIAGVNVLRREFPNLPLHAPRAELAMLTDAHANLSAAMGLHVVVSPADQPIAPGDTRTLGRLTCRALDVAGHSPGGLAYYCAAAGVVFTGDALFAGSIGRTDFPQGSLERLCDNIRHQLFTLPDDTVVYSGHGPATTIGEERETNPWVRTGRGG